jgi:adenylate cyclase class IV
MQNVEFKAEVRDLALARTIAGGLGAVFVEVLEQTDTYFRVPDGKLKRRETVGRPTEWVFYARPNRSRAKLSNYQIYTDAGARERFGERELPVWTVVKKRRELWSYRGVRIHLDTVEGLGTFVEFEALVCPDRTTAEGHELVEFLRRSLEPAMGEAIACGYADLLAAEG